MKYFLCITLVGVSLLLQSCTPPTTQLLLQGKDAYQTQDYHTAYNKLLTAAKAGDHQAQYAVGYMYYYGIGVERDSERAIYWIKKAADAGYYNALAALEFIQQGKPPSMNIAH